MVELNGLRSYNIWYHIKYSEYPTSITSHHRRIIAPTVLMYTLQMYCHYTVSSEQTGLAIPRAIAYPSYVSRKVASNTTYRLETSNAS